MFFLNSIPPAKCVTAWKKNSFQCKPAKMPLLACIRWTSLTNLTKRRKDFRVQCKMLFTQVKTKDWWTVSRLSLVKEIQNVAFWKEIVSWSGRSKCRTLWMCMKSKPIISWSSKEWQKVNLCVKYTTSSVCIGENYCAPEKQEDMTACWMHCSFLDSEH